MGLEKARLALTGLAMELVIGAPSDVLRHLVAVSAIGILSACHPVERCPALEKLQRSDPVTDATAASARGDNRLLMLGGYVGTVPGAEGSNLPNRLLDGTTDTETEACYRLRGFAEAYALKYNGVIVASQGRRP